MDLMHNFTLCCESRDGKMCLVGNRHGQVRRDTRCQCFCFSVSCPPPLGGGSLGAQQKPSLREIAVGQVKCYWFCLIRKVTFMLLNISFPPVSWSIKAVFGPQVYFSNLS